MIQALLECKCIPSGMELFPAASLDQWTLIQRVIDDCDYYVIVVAGKYGSRGPDGRSYTEMEFDYAAQSGKPIIGFYHEDLDLLPGAKLEKSDDARKRLADFTRKVKQRMCRPWRSADGLGSSIKSAMLNEIEFNPRPGWIRADVAPDPELVRRLKERILELEQRLSKSALRRFITGDTSLDLPLQLNVGRVNDRTWQLKARLYRFHASLDEIFKAIAPKLTKPRTRIALKRILQHWLKGTRDVHEAGGDLEVHSVIIERENFDPLLQTFVAQDLLKRVSPPKNVRTTDLYWQLAPKGVKRLAELQAIVSC